jgi:hypothetical protein
MSILFVFRLYRHALSSFLLSLVANVAASSAPPSLQILPKIANAAPTSRARPVSV